MDLSYTPQRPAATRFEMARPVRAAERYLLWLGFVLTGYVLLSRGFAYWGVPPLFIGEITLGIGLVVAARAGRWAPLLAMPAVWILLALVGLTLVHTVPGIARWGLDAPRDAMQIGYAAFAFIAATLLIARPERLRSALHFYGRYALIVLSVIWAIYLVFKTFSASLPAMPGAPHVKIFEAKGGDIMVQLTGITLFVVMGFMKRTPLVITALVLNIGLIAVSNRGGMVAFAMGCTLAWMLRPPEARVGKLIYAFVVLVIVGILVGPLLSIHGGGRTISVEQLWTNIISIFGQGGDHLDGTKKWRIDWWEKIYDYTVNGPYFWTGKGFGINLARSDGFLVDPTLRSPHNGHMTILARMGVPGAALWVALQLAWTAAIARTWFAARAAGRTRWMGLLAALSGFWLAFHLNAAFDVYFEGPMGGVWFWTVFGVGLAATWIYRNRPEVLDDLPGAAAPAAPAPAPAWGWGAGAPEASGEVPAGEAPAGEAPALAVPQWNAPPASGDGAARPAVPTWTPVR